MRQQQQISWDTIHSELWLRAHYQPQKLNGSNRGGQGRNRGSGVRSNFPKGFCWKFHNGTHCNGCAFKHHCFKCGNNHPIFRCQQQQSPRLGEIPQQSSHPCLKTALSTPVNVAVLSRVLLGYNSHIAYRLIKGFSEGVKIIIRVPELRLALQIWAPLMRILTLLMTNYEKKENWVVSRALLIPPHLKISVFPLSALFPRKRQANSE